jgi:deoxyribodipyrimidine photo-lyase
VSVPGTRVRACNGRGVREDGAYVLHWMIAFRRPRCNFALQRAVEHARVLNKPLVVLEALRARYPWASERLHAFVLQGMADNTRAFEGRPVTYLPYVEHEADAGKGLLGALAAHACVVVTDDFPGFFIPRMLAAAGPRLPVLLEAVDSNGLLPLAATERVFPSAFAFRRFLQAVLPAHLEEPPEEDPLAGVLLPRLATLSAEVLERFPPAPPALLAGEPHALAALPVDRRVGPVPGVRGGGTAARTLLRQFLNDRLARYPEDRNRPEVEGTSGLSPHLHFGHLSVHEVFAAIARHEGWTPERLAAKASGKRAG